MIKSLWVTGGLIFLVRFCCRSHSINTFQLLRKTPEANFFKPHMVNLWVWDQRVLPWPWPSPWIFKAKIFWLPQNEKQTYPLKFWPQMIPLGLTLAMTLTWIFFKVKYVICYISAKMVWLSWNEKQTYRLNSRPQMWPWPLKVRCEDLTDSDRSDFRCRRAVDSFS